MKTTAIIVELVIVGSGPALGLGVFLFFLTPLDLSLIPKAPQALLVSTLFIACYVFGIIIDRISDRIGSIPEDWVRSRTLNSLSNAEPDQLDNNMRQFGNMRSIVFTQSEHVRDWLTYGRLRIRVARGWSFNSAAILCVIFTIKLVEFDNKLKPFLDFSIWFFLALLAGCLFAWYDLSQGECRRIVREHERIEKNATTPTGLNG